MWNILDAGIQCTAVWQIPKQSYESLQQFWKLETGVQMFFLDLPTVNNFLNRATVA